MDDDEITRGIARCCGLTLGIVLGLVASAGPAGWQAMSTRICIATLSEAGRDGRADCLPDALASRSPVLPPAQGRPG